MESNGFEWLCCIYNKSNTTCIFQYTLNDKIAAFHSDITFAIEISRTVTSIFSLEKKSAS
uniref:Uncharacterized protein n=1 Tax=Rhizophora mucronata TaxID=61149 RepID=A0A2P2PNP9_RHIMU